MLEQVFSLYYPAAEMIVRCLYQILGLISLSALQHEYSLIIGGNSNAAL